MLYGSFVLVERLFALGNEARDIPAPKWLLTVTMPLGFALLAYRFLEAGWRLLRGGDSGDSDSTPVRIPSIDVQIDRLEKRS
jgi:C4-dicarboxylate transporter DctQ subunit